MLEKLYEMIDSKVLTESVKTELQSAFNEAVEKKAQIIADSRILEESQQLKNKYEDDVATLNEKCENYKKLLTETANEYVEMVKNELTERVDDYLDYTVDNFINESKENFENSLVVERARAVNASFNHFAQLAGVNLAKTVADTNPVNESLKEQVDKLTNENIQLKKDNDHLLQEGILLELCNGLSDSQAAKFTRLAKSLVPFQRTMNYKHQLEELKENVIAAEIYKEKQNSDLNETVNLNESESKQLQESHKSQDKEEVQKLSNFLNTRLI